MKAWTYAVIFGIGGALGFAGGWCFSKRRYEEKADEEIKEIKNYYHKKRLEEEKRMEEINAKIEEKILNVDNKPADASKTAYNRIGDDEKVLAEKEVPEEEEPTKPYLITEEEYLNGKNENEKLSLTYYVYDDTLADDCDEMVDIEETISSDIYNQIIDSDGDLYVRNPITETDYEIMKVEASFHERYGGY